MRTVLDIYVFDLISRILDCHVHALGIVIIIIVLILSSIIITMVINKGSKIQSQIGPRHGHCVFWSID